jgi:hypothetical protein
LFGSPARRRLLDEAIAAGRDWYYGDHGIFRRFQYYRVTRNAYQHPGTGHASPHRFEQLHVQLQPWQPSIGGSIVICPNSPAYMAWYGIDAKQWTLDCIKRVGELSDRPIVVRWKASAKYRPFYVDLHLASMVVVFSSACAIEALASGIPICTLAPWASTARMGIQSLDDLNTPYLPSIDERDQFLFNLADNQWTLAEIEQGLAWRHFNACAT